MTSTMDLADAYGNQRMTDGHHAVTEDHPHTLKARAALEQRIKELEADAARGRHLMENGCWHRSEDQTHLAVLVPHGSDLSCYAMRVVAVDRAMSEAALTKAVEISQELGLP